MSVEGIQISLRGWYSDDRRVSAQHFTLPLRAFEKDPQIVTISQGKRVGQAALIVLFRSDAADTAPVPEDGETLDEVISIALSRIGSWLNERSPEVFHLLRADGLKIDLFIGLWITNDQLDLALPPELLTACGERGISIEIISND